MPKIYTKTGDYGKTATCSGTRVDKSHLVIELNGEIDELSVRIGTAISCLKTHNKQLRVQQCLLQNINSIISSNKNNGVDLKYINELENDIDELTLDVQQLKSFILPGSNFVDGLIHQCRTQTRKVERVLWSYLLDDKDKVDPSIPIYFNRLSDYFFSLARYHVHVSGDQEQFLNMYL